MPQGTSSRHNLVKAALVALNLILWPYDLKYRHPAELNLVIGLAVGLFVGWGLSELYAMAFVEGGAETARRLRQSPARAAVVGVWGLGVVAAVVWMAAPGLLPTPLPGRLRGLPGEEYMKLGLYPYAEKAYRKEIAASGETAQLRYGIGLAQFELGRFDEAVASVRKGMALEPDSESGYYHLVMFYLTKARPEEALRIAREGISRVGPRPALRGLEAAALSHTGDLASAERIYAGLCEKHPNDLSWPVKRAETLYGLDKFSESREAVDGAVAKGRALVDEDPSSIGALQALMASVEALDASLTKKGLPTKLPEWKLKPAPADGTPREISKP